MMQPPKKTSRDYPLSATPEPGNISYSSPFPKGSKPVEKADRRPKFIKEADSVITDRVTRTIENEKNAMPYGKALKHVGNVLLKSAGLKK
jgi:hypothetical protein